MATPCTSFASVSLPLDWHLDILDVAAVILSFVPWITGAAVFAGLIFVVRKSPAYRALCIGLAGTWAICEVLKRVIRQPRPTASCLTSLGMPSAHSANALVWIIFAIMQPRLSDLLGAGPPTVVAGAAAASDFGGMVVETRSSSSGSADSAASGAPTTRKMQLARLLVVAVNLAVPWSRVHLSDHSPAQVSAGALVGVVFSAFLLFAMSKQKKPGS